MEKNNIKERMEFLLNSIDAHISTIRELKKMKANAWLSDNFVDNIDNSIFNMEEKLERLSEMLGPVLDEAAKEFN